ncbi:ATP-binding protein [Oscillospiraceae bacterium 38-13]
MKKINRKKTTIFRIFLIPLIAIMLLQSGITIGTLVVRRTTKTLEEYSGNMMTRLVENRGVILQNDMNQRWASIYEQEPVMNGILERYLENRETDLETLLQSGEEKEELLGRMFPECLDILQNSSTTGVFLVLTGPEAGAGEYDGFFIRDSDPDTNPVNFSDLLLERGSKELSRAWNIPLDTNWTTRFHMEGGGTGEAFFYEPWRAGEAFPDADTADLGYWALPFRLGSRETDSHEMITYSLPLRSQGRTYGVLGVEISSRSLYDYFPVAELNDSQQSGYLLAVKDGGRYTPLVGKGMLYDLVRSMEGGFVLRETDYEALTRVEGAALNGQGLYAVERPLKLYSNHVPYENTEWSLLGLDTEEDLFGMSRRLYIWMVAAVFIGLGFGVLGIYLVVRHLTRPVQRLMQCISQGAAALQGFRPSNILEIDALHEVVVNLTEQQRKAENILLEEKERYKVALESSKDFFYSYDVHLHMLDIFNHPTMSGQWRCDNFGGGVFIDPQCIHEADRDRAVAELQRGGDELYAEFRLAWPKGEAFKWVALAGKAVYDTDGQRWKLVGSIRDIQEQKEREAEQLRKNTIDGVTGLYAYSAGIKELTECRKAGPEGIMACLLLDQLKQINEKNGIVFGDMILEELGGLVRRSCQDYTERTGRRTAALRLNRDEFVLWLEGEAAEPVRALLEEAAVRFQDFSVQLRAGLVRAGENQDTEQLIRMAKQARGASRLSFYEEQGAALPPLQAHEINSLGYGEDVSLVSVALNLFGKGGDFPEQMMLMVRKIGRYYQAEEVLVSLLRADFNSNYLNYQWHSQGENRTNAVQKYKEEEKKRFFEWMGPEEVRWFSSENSREEVLQRFLNVLPGQEGILLPMYDSGSYMGNVCILGLPKSLLEDAEEYQNLAELGRVIQSQLNQQQHDIASKAKSEFLSRMSHEIRTPMNGIIGMTAIALQKEQTPERILDCLQKIQSSSNYLLGLINDILDMSKIESGKMKLEAVDFDMREMLDTIQELIQPQTAAKEICFTQEISLEHNWFRADRMRISQVLINLLGNAVKFTPARGQVTLAVEETIVGGESQVCFMVRDTGVGIAKEEQERVFRSFEQAGTNPSKQQGTGLGLSISSRLVQMMGSNIQLESAPGEGSTFSFTIPLAGGTPMETGTHTEEISFKGYRILVVEDNELNAEIAQCLLEERDFEVECVYDGAQAVERIRTTPPGSYDVILMDIMMPVMDGLEATRVIRSMDREDCHTIPIIAMSANAFDDDLKKSVKCGMNGHLSKPVEVEKLYRVLDEVLH